MKATSQRCEFEAQDLSVNGSPQPPLKRQRITSAIVPSNDSEIEKSLRRSELFSGMPNDDITKIAQFSISKRISKGAYLFYENDSSHGFYIIQKGSINLHRVHPSGKEQIIHVFRKGESMGVAMLSSATVCPGHARAEETSRVLLIRRNEFLDMLQLRRDLIVRVLGSMCKQCRAMMGRIDDLTLQDVETRLGNWLLERCPNPLSQQPVTIELTTSKRLLAAELGTISETLSRTFAKLRKLDLLEVNGKLITVMRPDKVTAYLTLPDVGCTRAQGCSH